MEEQELRRLLARSKQGLLTPEEHAQLDRWYAALDPSGRGDEGVFRDSEHESAVRERLLARILEKMPTGTTRRTIRMRRLVQWAAAVLLLCVSAVSFYHFYTSASNGLPFIQEYQTSTAPVGKLLKVQLGDGSEVVLNAGSSVTYPKHFANDIREVRLEGEAFFDVAPDASKPFVVRAGKMDVRVIGTSFNVRAHPDMDNAKVTVATGKVSVEAEGKTLSQLNPNQEISYDQQTARFAVADIDAQLATTWQSGEVRLDGVSFQELAIVVKNTWGMTLETASERLMEANYKTTFHVSNPVDDVMQVIGKIASANYQITDHKILLYE